MSFRPVYKSLGEKPKERPLTTTGKRLAAATTALAPPKPKVSALAVRRILPAKGMVMGRVAARPPPRSVSRGLPRVAPVAPVTAYFGRFDSVSRPPPTHHEVSINTESVYAPIDDVLGIRRGLLARVPPRPFVTSMVAPYPGASYGIRTTPMLAEKRAAESESIATRYGVTKATEAEELAEIIAAEDQSKRDKAYADARVAHEGAKRYERYVRENP